MSSPVTLERTDLATAGGATVPALIARPSQGRVLGGIVLAQHIGGLSPTMEDEARRAAERGLVCVVPSFFHRLGDIVLDPVSDDPAVAEIRRICLASLTPASVAADLTAALDWLDRIDGPASPRCVVGYGGGAAQAMLAAPLLQGRLAGLAAILGAGFLDPATLAPRLSFGALGVPLYFGFAEQDRIIPSAQVAALERHLAGAGTPHRLVRHPGAQHGYAFRGRAEFLPDASEADWSAILEIVRGEVSGASAEERHGRTA